MNNVLETYHSKSERIWLRRHIYINSCYTSRSTYDTDKCVRNPLKPVEF